MMNYADFLVRQEHDKELLQEAERERLIRAAGLQQPGNWKLYRRVVDWIGAQMISWGYKLQRYGAEPSACAPSCRVPASN
jgi:hypothetical protein